MAEFEHVPDRHDRLAAAMLTHLVDHGLREAVKWVMEPEILAIETVVEQRVRERIAAEIEAEHWQQARTDFHTAPLLRAAQIARGGKTQ